MIDDILSRLERVKRTGKGNWLACCPAHEDRSPSLTLHQADDGRVLVRCWAGCEFEQIVNAVGLGWEPWFPPKQAGDFKPPVRRPYPAADVLEATAFEAGIVALAASNLANGVELTQEDRKRLHLCAERIWQARELANG